jgi:hypothetical protein
MADYVTLNSGEVLEIPHELEADPEGRAAFIAAALAPPPKTEEE